MLHNEETNIELNLYLCFLKNEKLKIGIYLTKPFRPGELLATICSNLRTNTSDKKSIASFNDLEIDHIFRLVKFKSPSLVTRK